MGTYASITLNGFTIEEWKNTWHRWHFRESERVRELDKDSGEVIFQGYRSTAGTIRKRLALEGYTEKQLENEFHDVRKTWISKLESWGESDYECALKILRHHTNINEWIHLFIDANKIGYSEHESQSLHNDNNLLNFMLSDDFDEYPNYTAGDFHFPCKTSECWTVAILSFTPDDALVELDMTDLISAGWADDFHDIAEMQSGKTSFYSNFSSFLDELVILPTNLPEFHLMQRLAFSGVFSALEAYLSDTMKKQVLNRPAVKRRFIESHDKFSGMKKFSFNEIFKKMDELDQLIIDELDFISFHNMDVIPELFKRVLFIDFPKDCISALCEAVKKRHDIVHRNGKDTSGKLISVTNQDVIALTDLVRRVVSHIDNQILNLQRNDIE